jgi:hypothetical protein
MYAYFILKDYIFHTIRLEWFVLGKHALSKKEICIYSFH